jgi:hypothetical protein
LQKHRTIPVPIFWNTGRRFQTRANLPMCQRFGTSTCGYMCSSVVPWKASSLSRVDTDRIVLVSRRHKDEFDIRKLLIPPWIRPYQQTLAWTEGGREATTESFMCRPPRTELGGRVLSICSTTPNFAAEPNAERRLQIADPSRDPVSLDERVCGPQGFILHGFSF